MNSEVGFGRKVLEAIEEEGITFEHLPSGIDTMSVVLSAELTKKQRKKIINNISASCEPDDIRFEDGLALIAVVGRGMVSAKGTAARVCIAIANADINIRMIDQGSCELNIVIGVEEHDFQAALSSIYSEFVK